jgi:hypothetical protein
MNLSRRVDEIESTIRLVGVLKAAGLSAGRIGEVLSPGLEGAFERLTDEELRAIAGPEDAPIFPGGPRLKDLTDEQLQRIANGEPPRIVCDQ